MESSADRTSHVPVVVDRDSDGETVTVRIRAALEVDENGKTVVVEDETERG